MEDMSWKNEELRKWEDALPSLNECEIEKVSREYQAKTGVGCDGFHLKVLLDLTKETGGEIVEFWVQVKQSGKWPQQACTAMFFLIPKNVTNERPIALMPTLIRWWEALRAPEVAKWQLKYRVNWDATDGRNGGGQPTVWEILMEMAREKKIWERWPWFWTWRRPSSESASLWFGPGRRTSASRGRSCGRFVDILSTRGVSSSKGMWRSRSRPSRPSWQGPSGVVCFCVLCC